MARIKCGNVKTLTRLRHLIFLDTDFKMFQQNFDTFEKANFLFIRTKFDELSYLVYVKGDDNYLIVTKKRLDFLKSFWQLDIQILDVGFPGKSTWSEYQNAK